MQPTMFATSKTLETKSSSGKASDESKENSAPNNLINFEMQDEVFIDDQVLTYL
jgi:hypothetical protein